LFLDDLVSFAKLSSSPSNAATAGAGAGLVTVRPNSISTAFVFVQQSCTLVGLTSTLGVTVSVADVGTVVE